MNYTTDQIGSSIAWLLNGNGPIKMVDGADLSNLVITMNNGQQFVVRVVSKPQA